MYTVRLTTHNCNNWLITILNNQNIAYTPKEQWEVQKKEMKNIISKDNFTDEIIISKDNEIKELKKRNCLLEKEVYKNDWISIDV